LAHLVDVLPVRCPPKLSHRGTVRFGTPLELSIFRSGGPPSKRDGDTRIRIACRSISA